MKTDYPGLLYDDFKKYQYLIIMQDKAMEKAKVIVDARQAAFDKFDRIYTIKLPERYICRDLQRGTEISYTLR